LKEEYSDEFFDGQGESENKLGAADTPPDKSTDARGQQPFFQHVF
jgi:hypothetical protein